MTNLDTTNGLLASAFGLAAFGDDYQPHVVKTDSETWSVFQYEDLLGFIYEDLLGFISKYDEGEYYIQPLSEFHDPNYPDRWLNPHPTLEEALADFTAGTRRAYRAGARNGKPINR